MPRKLEVCTTYNKEYYDLCGRHMIETFQRYWPTEVILHVYWQEQEPEITADNIVYHELYQVQPLLKDWVDRHTDRRYHGWREDRGKFVWKNNGVKFSHKVFAQTHRIRNSTADIILYSDADTEYTARPNLAYLSEICPADSLCTFFDRRKLRDETGFYMHNPRHPRAVDWANRMEEIYLTGELWGYDNQQADQYTMAIGRDSFKDCKQTDLMKHYPGIKNSDPVPHSPLAEFLNHMKGDKKNQ